MPAPSPDTLKQAKDFSRPVATFAIARVPGSERAFLGCQDFKVYEANFAAAKFEPKELYAHGSYVTGVALAGTTLVTGGYDCKLTWFDTEAARRVVESPPPKGPCTIGRSIPRRRVASFTSCPAGLRPSARPARPAVR